LGAIGVTGERLLHVAQSLYHDHVPAQAAGLPTVWIDRRGDREGMGATPAPTRSVTPHWRFTSMAELAAAAVPDRPGA
jgi:putative hydrolase of the HAD superfamily